MDHSIVLEDAPPDKLGIIEGHFNKITTLFYKKGWQSQQFNANEFKNYAIRELGCEKGTKVPDYSKSDYLQGGLNAASLLAPKYDLGVGIAKGGLWLSYLFSLYGLQIANVDMKRILNGATYKPLKPFGEGQIKDKKIILFDNDVVTGRTLRRIVKELYGFKPQKIDLLLLMYYTTVNITNYGKIKKFLKKEHKVMGEQRYGKYRVLLLDTTCQIPKEIGEVFAIKASSIPPSKEYREGLEKILFDF